MNNFQKGVIIFIPSAIFLSLVFFLIINMGNPATTVKNTGLSANAGTVNENMETPNYQDNQNQARSDQKISSGNVVATEALAVSPYKCIGCGRCARLDPEHFTLNSHKSTVISQNNLNSPNLQSAINSCPVGAISLT